MIIAEQEWPPTYQLRRHARARGVKFIMSPTRGLQITVPPRFNLKQLPAILEEHKAWILKNTISHPPVSTPTEINFLSMNLQLSLHYFPSAKPLRIKTMPVILSAAKDPHGESNVLSRGSFAALRMTGAALRMTGAGLRMTGDLSNWREKLTLWVRKFATQIITEYFNHVSTKLGLPYRDLSIRSQATLWGSCSPDKSIRLNYKLIFLPEVLMRHIMIHELCHTRYMDHSPDFWQLVASFDENWREHRKAMKTADKYIPRWIIN